MGKSTCSLAKKLANQRNAQKSTGPKTEQGKNVSRLNALTHGLRAVDDLIPGEDPAMFEAERAAWIDDWKPQTTMQLRLVEKGVRAAWRGARCFRAENALMTKLANDAALKFDRRERAALKRAKETLNVFAGKVEEKFNYSWSTMDVLCRTWADLHSACASGDWTPRSPHHDTLCHLLDHGPHVTDADHALIKETSKSLMELLSNKDHNEQVLRLELASSAFRVLCQILDDCVQNCQGLRDRHLPTDQLRQAHMDASMLESGKEGALLLRYEATFDRQLNSAIKLLNDIAKTNANCAGEPLGDASAEATPQFDAPEPTPQPAPTPEPATPTPEPEPLTPQPPVPEPEPLTPSPAETNEANYVLNIGEITTSNGEYRQPPPGLEPIPIEYAADGQITAYSAAMIYNRIVGHYAKEGYVKMPYSEHSEPHTHPESDHACHGHTTPPRQLDAPLLS